MLEIPELVKKFQSSMVNVVVARGGDSGSGSGFIYDAQGLALTNEHVVAGATSVWVIVTNADGTKERLRAGVLGTNADKDIALVQFGHGCNYVPTPLGSVENIDLGDEVIALGYPLSMLTAGNLIVAQGIVSNIRNDGKRTIIQHTAAVNPGSSGGPLISRDGLVVGINTAVVRAIEGIDTPIEGFNIAVAIDEAKRIIGDLETGTVDFSSPDETFLFKGIAFAGVGEHKRAIREFTKAIKRNPKDPSYYFERGRSYHADDKHKQAIRDYNTTIRLDASDSADTYFEKGLAYTALGEHKRAIREFTKAIKRDSQEPTYYYERGRSYHADDNHKWAIKDYDKAIKLDSQNAVFYYNRSEAYSELAAQDIAKAKELGVE